MKERQKTTHEPTFIRPRILREKLGALITDRELTPWERGRTTVIYDSLDLYETGEVSLIYLECATEEYRKLKKHFDKQERKPEIIVFWLDE